MDRATLLELADQDLAQAMRIHSRFSAEGAQQEQDGLLLVSGNHRFPVGMWNAAFPLAAARSDAHASQWLDRAREFFGKQQRGFTVYAGQHRDSRLAEACRRAGLRFQRPSPAMAITRRVPEASAPQLLFRRATTPQVLSDFVRVAGQVYADSGLPCAITERIFADAARVLATRISVWVGYTDAHPVTCCWVHQHGPVAGLYWVATLPAYQGRGYGDAVSRRATNAAFEASAQAVVLQASEAGEPIYRRIGYEVISHYHWAFAPRAEPPTGHLVTRGAEAD